jgi:hypothetical protein
MLVVTFAEGLGWQEVDEVMKGRVEPDWLVRLPKLSYDKQ